MGRLLVSVVVVSSVLMCGAHAQAADVPLTGNIIAKSSPQDTARLLGVEGEDFAAQTIYATIFLGSAPGNVILFETPHAVLPGICEVAAVDVHLEPKPAPGMQANGNTPVDVVSKVSRKLFTVAEPFGISSDWTGVNKQDADEICSRQKIVPDIYSRNAADNLFSADTPEVALNGARALGGVVSAAAGQGPLPFKLDCEGPAEICATPRDTIAKLSVHRFESAAVVDCNAADETCYHVSGGDYQVEWSADIALAHRIGDGHGNDIVDVKFVESFNPLQ